MRASNSAQEETLTPKPPLATDESACGRNTYQSHLLTDKLIIVASMALLLAFFLPWITFLGAEVSGLTIQRLSQANQMLLAIPLLAFCALGLNLASMPSSLIRRLAGLSPYVFLVLAVNRYGKELVQELEFGALLALSAGGVLVCIPEPKQKKHA